MADRKWALEKLEKYSYLLLLKNGNLLVVSKRALDALDRRGTDQVQLGMIDGQLGESTELREESPTACGSGKLKLFAFNNA